MSGIPTHGIFTTPVPMTHQCLTRDLPEGCLKHPLILFDRLLFIPRVASDRYAAWIGQI